jgi:general secretion pathway protein D
MKRYLVVMLAVALGACAQMVTAPHDTSTGHIQAEPETPANVAPIPSVVDNPPALPAPQPAAEPERYTVVVNEVPVKELLFAVARDAGMNVDVNPAITGVVTLNAVQQTLPQILERIAAQVNLRYEIKGATIAVTPDTPYFQTYKINFVNLSRDTTNTEEVSTQVTGAGSTDVTAGGGGTSSGGQNNSTTKVTSTSNQRFWSTLASNIMAIIGETPTTSSTPGSVPVSKSVIANPETGVLTVLASSRQHAQVQKLLDEVMASAERQVLVEATIVEVNLNDRYTAGIQWSEVAGKLGSLYHISVAGTQPDSTFNQVTLGQFFTFNYNGGNTTNVTLNLLKEYGDVKVLSSPKLMVLNNQTAVLKVVDNQVYFTIKADTTTNNNIAVTTFTSNLHTVPIGLVMSVTPQINENSAVMLNVRPTISRINGFVNDPNPALAQARVTNPIPVVQTREMESLLRVNSGQTAVLGGLMTDDVRAKTQGVPTLQDIFPFGELFKQRDDHYQKSELVVFLRPTVIKDASLNGDFKPYKPFLNPPFDTGVVKPPEQTSNTAP